MRIGIPSEGTILWRIGWALTTGIEFRARHGLNYGVLMRHEHVNTASEIESVLRVFFKAVRREVYGVMPALSLYQFFECGEAGFAALSGNPGTNQMNGPALRRKVKHFRKVYLFMRRPQTTFCARRSSTVGKLMTFPGGFVLPPLCTLLPCLSQCHRNESPILLWKTGYTCHTSNCLNLRHIPVLTFGILDPKSSTNVTRRSTRRRKQKKRMEKQVGNGAHRSSKS
jgi:hypothetical protein